MYRINCRAVTLQLNTGSMLAMDANGKKRGARQKSVHDAGGRGYSSASLACKGWS
jgi:hypothetical protein